MAQRLDNSLLNRALRQQPTKRPPIWMMRQAGRYQASYRKLREQYGLLEIVEHPELAMQVTLAAINEFGFDAGIIFSDILTIPNAMGLKVSFEKGEGPKIQNPIRHMRDVEALAMPQVEEALGYCLKAIGMTSEQLSPRGIPLIGFAGAPFTLACYAIEGGGSKDFATAKRFMYEAPEAFFKLMSQLAKMVGDYLVAQVAHGASAVQIFDSWAGLLSPQDYQTYALPFTRQVIAHARSSGAPVVYFSTGTSAYFDSLTDMGQDGISVDWRAPLGALYAKAHGKMALCGNLDPLLLQAPWPTLKAAAEQLIQEARQHDPSMQGYVFNLGHGILPNTPEDNVKRLVEWLKAHTLAA